RWQRGKRNFRLRAEELSDSVDHLSCCGAIKPKRHTPSPANLPAARVANKAHWAQIDDGSADVFLVRCSKTMQVGLRTQSLPSNEERCGQQVGLGIKPTFEGIDHA